MAMPEPNIETPGWNGYTSFIGDVFCIRENRFDQETKEEGLLILAEMTSRATERLESCSTQGLESAMSTGDHAATVEMALRIYTGTHGPEKDVEKALRMWQRVTRVQVTSSAAGSAGVREAQADAYLLICAHHLRRYDLTKSMLSLASAIEAAAAAAKLGKYRRCSWRAAIEYQMFLDSLCEEKRGKRSKNAKRSEGAAVVLRTAEDKKAWAKFKSALSDENNVFDRITQRHLADNRARMAEKKRDRPVSHRCSRPECPATTTSLSGFRRCAGRCSRDDQAHYCTKECQVLDWKRHRQVCKRPTEKIVTVRNHAGETVDVDTSGLKTSQAEALRQLSDVTMSESLPHSLQELLKKLAVESNVPFNEEQILQCVTDWF